MKLESIKDLYFVLAIFVPGFIYDGVLRQFVPLHTSTMKETVFLKLLTATAFNYAVSSPLIFYLLYHDGLFSLFWRDFSWFFIILLLPALLALIRAKAIQSDGLDGLFRILGLRSINPIPTGWDWFFSRANGCFILITLTDGSQIAGWFGSNSMASSDPERKDIYVEKVYTIPEDGSAWVEVPRSLGIQVDGSQIAHIEFRS